MSFGAGPGGLLWRDGEEAVELSGLGDVFAQPTLNPLLAQGRSAWDEAIAAARGHDGPRVPLSDARFHIPFEVAARGLRAKIRCGGERVPTVEELADFIRGCRSRGLVFKATAGLHHAYPTDSGEHGFLNVLAAAVFGDEEEALRERPPAFALDAASFRWRDHEALPARLADVRASLLHSIGTCSFFEPVEELARLGILS